MRSEIRIGNKLVGDGRPVYVIAEIGINHNGSLDLAKRMVDGAVLAGCDAVRFQRPELVSPGTSGSSNATRRGPHDLHRLSPHIELGAREYAQIDAYCRDRGISGSRHAGTSRRSRSWSSSSRRATRPRRRH